VTGIGGQGVQLAAQVLARAAIAEGKQVQMFGSYGGMMRGGKTEATVVFSDDPIEAPPTVARTWSAIVMHPEHAPDVVRRIADGGLLLVNSSICDRAITDDVRDRATVVELKATDLAVDAGNVVAASMIMVGAYAVLSRVASTTSIDGAIAASLPSYRTQHIELSQRAAAIGCAAVSELAGAR
jgi:Pyruvate/2-oxoacid:ferredoxin oxidoreductase gamma subunit